MIQRRWSKLSVVLFCLVPSACQFVRLDKDLEQMEKYAAINGVIRQAAPNDNPMVVALFSEKLQLSNLVDAKLIDSREFRFTTTPGEYLLVAFEDTNRDFKYQAGEPAGYHGKPTPILLGPGEGKAEIFVSTGTSLVDRSARARAERESGNDFVPKLWLGRKNIAAIVTLEDRRFDREIAKMGLWEPLKFTLEVGPGLYLLEPYDEGKIPIVFVHGINGTPRDWAALIEGLDRSRFQPWFLSYASGLPLEAHAKYLFDALTQLRLLFDFDDMYLVAHSMGGLVSQTFLERYRESRADYLKLFVTFSTPWNGHQAAQLGVDNAPVVVPAWRDMAPGSALLGTLRRSALPAGLDYYLLFGYGGGSLFGGEANDGTVTLASQLQPAAQARARRITGFDADHVGILSDGTAARMLNDLFDEYSAESGGL